MGLFVKNPVVVLLGANTLFLSLLTWICLLFFFVSNISATAVVILGLIHFSSLLVVGIMLIKYSSRARDFRDNVEDLISTTEQISIDGYVHKMNSTNNDLAGLRDAPNLMGSEISRSMEKLKLENGTWTQIMDSMADGVIVLDGDGQVTLFNHPARGNVQYRRFGSFGESAS